MNKKLLTALALNTLAAAYGEASSGAAKTDRLYDGMIKNINTDKTNKGNYKLIENILKQKNKELKDLYLQSDYTVKPEYLEWQIVFTGFYNEKNRGDNTLSSAEYYSETETADRNSTMYENQSLYGGAAVYGKFKPYMLQEDRFVDLGMSLNVKGISKDMSDINVENIQPVDVNIGVSYNLPASLSIPEMKLPEFNLKRPNVITLNFNPISMINVMSTGGNSSYTVGFTPQGTGQSGIIAQMDIASGNISAVTAVDPFGSTNPGYYSYTLDNVIGSPSAGEVYGQRYNNVLGVHEDALLPTGVYSDSILNSGLSGLFFVRDNPVTRLGNYGGNVSDFTVTLEGNVVNPLNVESILHYNADYTAATMTEITYTLDELEANSWITSAEKTELSEKFLDPSLGHTTANRAFQFAENNGTWNLKGSDVVAANQVIHFGFQAAHSVFINRGIITGLNEASSTNNLLGKQLVFLAAIGNNQRKHSGFDNTGRVEMRAPQSVAYFLGPYAYSYYYYENSASNTLYDGEGKQFLMNNGDIKLYGNNNVGVYTNTASTMRNQTNETYYLDGTSEIYRLSQGGLQNSEIRFNNPLTVLGDESIGVDIERVLDFDNSKIKIDVGTEDPRQNVSSITGHNGLENSGNTAGGDPLYTDGSSGVYINMTGYKPFIVVKIVDQINPANDVDTAIFMQTVNPQFTLSDYLLNVGSYSRGGAGLRVEEYGDVILGASSDTGTNHEINLLAGGKNNAGIYISGSEVRITTDGMILNIDGTEQVGVQIENNGKFFHKNGTITINGSDNTGIAVKASGYGELSDTGRITVKDNNLGVYNNGIFNMTGGGITANGTASAGVYSAQANTDTNLSGGLVRAENGGVGLYSDKNSIMNLSQGLVLESGNKGLLFYNYDSAGSKGKYNMTGTVSATVENGGNAFYVKNGQALTNYLTDSFTGSGKLDLTMQSGSKLYILEGKGTTLNLTTIDGIPITSGMLSPNIEINASSAIDYTPLAMDKGTLVLDRNVNLDNSSDVYKRSEFTSVSTDINNGTVLSGTQNNQTGTAQKNYKGTSGINEIKLNNMGTISLSGNGSTGMAADYGHIINNNKINMTGAGSIGIVSANGTLTENNGEIALNGANTAGIYGVNHLDGVTPSSVLGYGDDSINIANNGKITSTGTDKVYGIYADNKSGAVSNITLGSGSDINLGTSNGGLGIYVNNTGVTGGGTLTVGENGLGMYAKDSNINLTGMTVNLYGNNALGFYLDGTTNFSGSGNINVNGQNIVLFNANSNGTFSSNFNITAAAGSNYVVGNIKNGTFYYNGTSNLGSDGSLINGTNSMVLYDTAANVTGTGTNIIGATLNGQYTGIVPAGFTAGIEGENRGNISLGDSSAGLYGINGARLLNKGNISVGNASIGMSGKGSGSGLRNDGNILIGQASEGMYGNESTDITNTGSIAGTSSNGIGIYAESTSGMTVNNTGTIDVQGNDSRGIYVKGVGIKTIINTGTVKTGNSTDASKSGVGIYSGNAGDTITNNGTVETGASSVGIYSKSGIMNQNKDIITGVNGTGIYADGSTVNLNTGSTLTVGSDNGVGVYALNGANVINNGVTVLGNGSYGYALKSGANLVNNTAGTLGESSVLVYADGAGSVTNTGQITMTGSNNAGIYSENDGTIINSAVITGISGQANMGIYNHNGSINNTGNIHLGDSVIISPNEPEKNSYAIGIYADNSVLENHGNISVGADGIGIYSTNSPTATKNYGDITSTSDGAVGIFADHADIENRGNITLDGKKSIGIYGNKSSNIVNYGIITVNNEDSTGVMLNVLSTLDNQGIINVNGNNSNAVVLKGKSRIVNSGTLNIAGGLTGSTDILYSEIAYPVPSIVNAGIIRVSENFEAKGIDISIKVDPATITAPVVTADAGAAFVSDAVKFYAPAFNTAEAIGVLSGFTTGTHASVYKFEDVFNPMTADQGGPDTGVIKVKSKSLTWRATPVLNEKGNVDIWMEKIPYDDFTSGLWYEDFGIALDGKYTGSTGKAGEIFDKLDSIEKESDFRHIMSGLSGNVYANMNQREETIKGVFDTSLNLLQNSENNTKENVKINVIAGKGKLTENTDGVVGYDYTTTGVLALREVERTYKHTFGYSAGYVHTGFEMNDGNKSEEDADTLQLGLHNKYSTNDWILRNDLTGRISFHNADRNINWTNGGRSNMSGKYETYSITSDNKLGKELSLGKNASITPYGGLEATYMTRPAFTEDGLEALEVKGNDAWSVKPKAGVELKGSVPLGEKNQWKLKGSLDVAYGYELGDLNEREYARLVNVESDYHKLSKPEEEKGVLSTKAAIGVEIEDRYGIFLTGEYKTGSSSNDEYRAGITLKAVF